MNALDVIDKAIARAQVEVGRLTRVVQSNADGLSRLKVGTTGPGLRWRHTEDQVALHCARSRLAALKAVWADVARAEKADRLRDDEALERGSAEP